MSKKPVPRSAVLFLIGGLTIFPIFIAVIWGVSVLLAKMGDATGGVVMGYVAMAAGILWAVDLIALVLVQAINYVAEDDRRDDS